MKISVALMATCIVLTSHLTLASAQQSPPQQSPPQQCFPECRAGYVCSPDGQCVSECNPVCDSGQRCMEGECYVTVKEANAAVEAASIPGQASAPAQTTSPMTPGNTRASERVVVLEAATVIQFLDTEYDPVVNGYGMEIAASFFPSKTTPYFIRPRVLIAFAEDENYYEPSIGVGYEYLKHGERLSGGVQVVGVFGLWPNVATSSYDSEPIGPYFGASVNPFVRFGRVSLALEIERGYQLASDPNLRVTTLGFVFGVAL